MKNKIGNTKRYIWVMTATFCLLAFQNCGQSVEFQKLSLPSVDEGDNGSNQAQGVDSGDIGNEEVPIVDQPIVCNPLDPSAECYVEDNDGLIGRLYYLTSDEAPIFNGNLNNAKLEDYRTFGHVVDANIIMTSFDISPRSWTAGFFVDDTSQVQDVNDNVLLEWFHLDMSGFISLPEGQYQLATISDDGIHVSINGNTVIKHDGTHAPAWDCSNQIISFSQDDKKTIRVEYFQGPREQIALQLFVRPVENGKTNCSEESGEYSIIPASAFSR